ncbi:MAG: hypothetical protein ACKOYP_01685, partial [Bacteroidota bacterium]
MAPPEIRMVVNLNFINMIRINIILLWTASLLLAGCTQKPASTTGKDVVLEVSRTTDFTVNGNGDHPAWDSARWVTIPRQDSSGVM